MNFLKEGWPRHVPLELELHGYCTARASLSEASGLLLFEDRIVIPASQREEIQDRLHAGHQGITKCRERVKMSGGLA